MTMGFCMVRKTSILTPRILSFSLVFFISVTAQSETRPDSQAYAIPPTPFQALRGRCMVASALFGGKIC